MKIESKQPHSKHSALHLYVYECPECHLKYKEKEWAEKCEAWCRERKSCNIEITAHAEENKKHAAKI